MSATLKSFLQVQTAVTQTNPIWQWQDNPLPLRQQTYICPTLPPDELISSARAVLLRGDKVMVIRDHQNEPYIIPGGRREPGETVRDTLQREVKEETGWSIGDTAVIGCVHFQHLGHKPTGYPYPHPHFFWAIFAARAISYDPNALENDFYVTSASFKPIREVAAWNLGDGQPDLLQTAVTVKLTRL